MLESLLSKVAGLQALNFIKQRLQHRFFSCKYFEIFKNTYLEEHLQTAASGATIFRISANDLTFQRPMFPSYRNQSIDLQSKLIDWIQHD